VSPGRGLCGSGLFRARTVSSTFRHRRFPMENRVSSEARVLLVPVERGKFRLSGGDHGGQVSNLLR